MPHAHRQKSGAPGHGPSWPVESLGAHAPAVPDGMAASVFGPIIVAFIVPRVYSAKLDDTELSRTRRI
jgi:hypothetical protein